MEESSSENESANEGTPEELEKWSKFEEVVRDCRFVREILIPGGSVFECRKVMGQPCSPESCPNVEIEEASEE